MIGLSNPRRERKGKATLTIKYIDVGKGKVPTLETMEAIAEAWNDMLNLINQNMTAIVNLLDKIIRRLEEPSRDINEIRRALEDMKRGIQNELSGRLEGIDERLVGSLSDLVVKLNELDGRLMGALGDLAKRMDAGALEEIRDFLTRMISPHIQQLSESINLIVSELRSRIAEISEELERLRTNTQ